MTRSLCLLAMLLAATGCEPVSTPGPGPVATPGSGPAPTPDGGPVSTGGPERVDYGPTRHPAENAHDYQLRQQGQAGPCGQAWDQYEATYFNWKNGQVEEYLVREAQRLYDECVAANGYRP